MGQIVSLDDKSELLAEAEILITDKETISTSEIEGVILNKEALRSSIATRWPRSKC